MISSFSDSTTGKDTTTGYGNRIFVTFCDMSQKAIDTTGYGPRPCGVMALKAALHLAPMIALHLHLAPMVSLQSCSDNCSDDGSALGFDRRRTA